MPTELRGTLHGNSSLGTQGIQHHSVLCTLWIQFRGRAGTFKGPQNVHMWSPKGSSNMTKLNLPTCTLYLPTRGPKWRICVHCLCTFCVHFKAKFGPMLEDIMYMLEDIMPPQKVPQSVHCWTPKRSSNMTKLILPTCTLYLPTRGPKWLKMCTFWLQIVHILRPNAGPCWTI